MKIWLLYALAALAGIVLGLFLPASGGDTLLFFESIQEYVIHIGRYIIFPLLFFAIVALSYEMSASKASLKLYGGMFVHISISTSVLSVLGALIVLLISPNRIPIIIEETAIINPPSIQEQILLLFPRNFFALFTGSGEFLLPLHVFAIILGIMFHRLHSTSLINLFEDMSQVFRKLNRYVLRVLTLGIFFLSTYRIVQIRDISEIELFSRFILVILITIFILIFLVIPAVLFIFRRKNPYTWLFACLPVCISALLSGDNYFSIASAVAVMNNNLGIEERKASAMLSLGAIFGRSGVAMISCMSFILILQSYSSLNISFLQYLWVIGACIFASFLLGASPSNSVLISLVYVSGWYMQGLEDGYLILISAIPILSCLAAFLDTTIVLFNCQLVIDKYMDSLRVKNFL